MLKKVLRNSSYILAAQSVIKVISFFYTIFIARSLGVSDFGLYSVALSYFSLVSAISDFGISRYMIREIAKENQKTPILVSCVVLLRLASIAAFFGIFSGILYAVDADKLRVSLTLIAVMAVLPQSIALSIDSIFIALQRTSLSALGSMILSVATTIAGVTLINNGEGVLGVVFALVIGQLVYAGLMFLISLQQKIEYSSKVTTPVLKEIIKGSLPYGILGILGLLYFKIDSLLLAYIRGSYETGIYSAAYRFIEAIIFIPTAISMAIFPIFVKMHGVGFGELKKLSLKVILTMGSVGAIVTILFWLILPTIISLLLPNYIASIGVIKILALAIPFIFIHIPLSQVLLSSDKYLKTLLIISVIPIAFNITVNLLFIPQFGYIAAAWITVLSDVLSLTVLLFAIRKHVFKNG